MNLRGRDLVAAICAIVLTRMAWTENYMSESISASLRLAFYTPRVGFAPLGKGNGSGMVAPPVPMDVDGDGIVEGMCVITRDNTTTTSKKWVVEIIDLKPLHRQATSPNNAPQAPFRPRVLFQSEPIGPENHNEEVIYPLKMTSGQVMIKPRHRSKYLDSYMKIKKKEEQEQSFSADSTDRTRHYFCGVDWHDAANNCHQHCPQGTQSECPNGMQCYADTPCDSQSSHSSDKEEKLALDKSNVFNLELTPGGGLPSVVTLWSDGTISLHSITADLSEAGGEGSSSRHSHKHHHKLALRQLWRKPFLKYLKDKAKRFEETTNTSEQEFDRSEDENAHSKKMRASTKANEEKRVLIDESKNEVQSIKSSTREKQSDNSNEENQFRLTRKRRGASEKVSKNGTTDSPKDQNTTTRRSSQRNQVTTNQKTYYSSESQHSSPSYSIGTNSSDTTSPTEITIPEFTYIRKTLMNHFNVKSKGSTFSLKPPTLRDGDDKKAKEEYNIKMYNQSIFPSFDSVLELRKYFCAYGIGKVPPHLHKTELVEEIESWIRYVIVPCLRQKNTISRPDVIDGKIVWKLLTKLGFRYSGYKYVLPNVSLKKNDTGKILGIENVNWFERAGDLYAMLCRFGLPSNCNFHEITEKECLQLELFLTTCEEEGRSVL